MEKNPAKDIAAEMRLQQNMEREVESIKDKMDALDEMAKVGGGKGKMGMRLNKIEN